jgi:hypothetical protein
VDGDALTLSDVAPDRVVGHGFAAAGEAREEIVDPEDLDGHGGGQPESLHRRARQARRAGGDAGLPSQCSIFPD